MESVLRSLASRLSDAHDAPLGAPPFYPARVLGLAVHAALLDTGLVCTGAEDKPSGAAFALPHRAVPPTAFVPPGWFSPPSTLAFRYRSPAGHSLLIILSPTPACDALVLSARTSDVGSPTATLSLALSTYTSPPPSEDEGILAAASAMASAAVHLRPLGEAEPSARFRAALVSDVLVPLFGEGAGGGVSAPSRALQQLEEAPPVHPLAMESSEWVTVTPGGSGTSPRGGCGHLHSPHNVLPHAATGQHLHPPPPPPAAAAAVAAGTMGMRVEGEGEGGRALTGRTRGDFDADLWPNASLARPGELLGGGIFGGGGTGGSLVGPDHALFAGGGWGAGAPPPPGVPPGARYDPLIGGVGPLGLLGGAGGRGAPFQRGEPGPDHLQPPPDCPF